MRSNTAEVQHPVGFGTVSPKALWARAATTPVSKDLAGIGRVVLMPRHARQNCVPSDTMRGGDVLGLIRDGARRAVEIGKPVELRLVGRRGRPQARVLRVSAAGSSNPLRPVGRVAPPRITGGNPPPVATVLDLGRIREAVEQLTAEIRSEFAKHLLEMEQVKQLVSDHGRLLGELSRIKDELGVKSRVLQAAEAEIKRLRERR